MPIDQVLLISVPRASKCMLYAVPLTYMGLQMAHINKTGAVPIYYGEPCVLACQNACVKTQECKRELCFSTVLYIFFFLIYCVILLGVH